MINVLLRDESSASRERELGRWLRIAEVMTARCRRPGWTFGSGVMKKDAYKFGDSSATKSLDVGAGGPVLTRASTRVRGMPKVVVQSADPQSSGKTFGVPLLEETMSSGGTTILRGKKAS